MNQHLGVARRVRRFDGLAEETKSLRERNAELEESVSQARKEKEQVEARAKEAEDRAEALKGELEASKAALEEAREEAKINFNMSKQLQNSFKEVLNHLKMELLMTRVEGVRSFLSSQSFKFAKMMALTTEYALGFNRAVAQLKKADKLKASFKYSEDLDLDADEDKKPLPPSNEIADDLLEVEEFLPLVEPHPTVKPLDVEAREGTSYVPQPRTPLVHRYPSWLPKVLECVKLTSKDQAEEEASWRTMRGQVAEPFVLKADDVVITKAPSSHDSSPSLEMPRRSDKRQT